MYIRMYMGNQLIPIHLNVKCEACIIYHFVSIFADGLVMYSFTSSRLVFLPLNSFVSEEKFVSNSSFKINVFCTMGSGDTGNWSWPDGKPVCKGSTDGRPIQRNGYFLTGTKKPKRTTNGAYTCKLGDESITMAFYLFDPSESE